MVYILTNEREAHVAQTRSVLTRMEQHGANREKAAFDHASVIYGDELNKSVITDYEHRLILLMSAVVPGEVSPSAERMRRLVQ